MRKLGEKHRTNRLEKMEKKGKGAGRDCHDRQINKALASNQNRGGNLVLGVVKRGLVIEERGSLRFPPSSPKGGSRIKNVFGRGKRGGLPRKMKKTKRARRHVAPSGRGARRSRARRTGAITGKRGTPIRAQRDLRKESSLPGWIKETPEGRGFRKRPGLPQQKHAYLEGQLHSKRLCSRVADGERSKSEERSRKGVHAKRKVKRGPRLAVLKIER